VIQRDGAAVFAAKIEDRHVPRSSHCRRERHQTLTRQCLEKTLPLTSHRTVPDITALFKKEHPGT
jgi:hypothetical protein